jgi:hypothetical protein
MSEKAEARIQVSFDEYMEILQKSLELPTLRPKKKPNKLDSEMSEEILELSYNRPYVKPSLGKKISWLDAVGKTRFADVTGLNADKVWVMWDGCSVSQPYSAKEFEKYLKDGTFKRV